MDEKDFKTDRYDKIHEENIRFDSKWRLITSALMACLWAWLLTMGEPTWFANNKYDV